jgi:cardiolipin synthase
MIWASLAALFTVAGIVSAVHAVMRTRTAQGAIAWSVALITLPYLTVPLYWVFGRRKFAGYNERWEARVGNIRPIAEQARANLAPHAVATARRIPEYEGLKALAHHPLSRGNRVDLLINGEATFDSIIAGIDAARSYVLVEFYIVHDDGLGRRLKDKLVEKARQGVRVYFVYDEMGSKGLPRAYLKDLRAAGAEITPFRTTQGLRNLFQVNFRNHRKIVVVDGDVAWVGGHNVGDEYLGLDPKMSPWRDTHVRIVGPAVLGAQAAFLLDWCWATSEVLDLDWDPTPSSTDDRQALVFATGPADDLETAKLVFAQLINAARRRVWIATPYFIPEPAVSTALQLAALRGTDVRVLVPMHNDSQLVRFASSWFMQELDGVGIKFQQLRDGFMHQKVMLVDDDLAVVGTHNFDNRSFLLNFEVSALVHDQGFAAEVEKMLEADMRQADYLYPSTFASKPFWFRFAMRLARLSAPIQ